jgi:cysteine desulfurase
VEEARDAVAALVGARAFEVVFTSGGTEANDLALHGAARAGSHVVSTAIEHASVLRALEAFAAAGGAVTLLEPARDGSVSPEQVVAALRPETTLVSIGWANGELGTIQPVAEIGRALRAACSGARRVPLHADAVQAAGGCSIDLATQPVDLVSLSGHKLGALPGVGALVVRDGVSLSPRLLGGPQERERRAGTENVPGIVSFGVAARLAREERAQWRRRGRELRETLFSALARRVPDVVRLGPGDGLPGTLSLGFPGVRGDALVIALDLNGVAAATGSACAAGAAEPSHVLHAIGCDAATAAGALRLSFDAGLTAEDAERAAAIVADCVARARAAGVAGVGNAA